MRKLLWSLAILVAFVCHQADADTNLQGVCAGCQAGAPADPSPGFSWKSPAPSDLVLLANGPGNWSTGTWQRWDQATTFVRACPQNIPQNSTQCAGDDFLPRSTWPPIVPPPQQFVPQFNSFEAEPRSVTTGGQVTVTWATQDMAGCSSSWAPQVPTSGNASLPITAETTVQISCTGLGGSSHIVAHRIRFQAARPFKELIRCVPYTMPEASGLHTQELPAGDIVYTFGCDMLDGYQWVQRALDPSRVSALPCLNPSWLAAIALNNAQAADEACVDRPMTPAQAGVSIALTKRWKARFAVQGGGTVTRRPVYARNEDGTRGAQLRIGGVLQYVLAGVPCDGRSRLVGIATRYHSVAGQTSQQGATLPAASYAQCVKQDPPANGFP